MYIDSSQNPILFKFKMNPQEELRRKYTCVNNYKSTGPSNNLLLTKEWKRTDVSREKQDRKLIIDRQQPKINPLLAQDPNKPNPKTINFKNLKQTVPKKQTVTTVTTTTTAILQKNMIHPPHSIKPALEYYGSKNIRSPPQAQAHGISINVNIQNMIPHKNMDNMDNLPMSDRSMLGEEKKSKKVSMIINNPKIDDFQCKEEIIYKRTAPEKQNKLPQKPVQKRPLIDRKHIKPSQPHIKPKQKMLDFKQQIKKFQTQIQSINSFSQTESINYLDHRQQAYLIPPYYIQKNQKNYSWKMRVTLFQWMMHVSYQFSLKRQTFYIAVNLVDLYLSKEHHVQRTDFQLAGTAAMFIASKLEEFEPKCSDQFAKATKKYTAQQVKQMQKRICKTLKYTLNPPTLSTWANRIMLQWDTFLQQNEYAQKHSLFALCEHKFFKKCDTQSYRRFRTIMQFLDCATLDIETVQYQPKLLVCAFMYLVLGHGMGIFKQEEIWRQFPRTSLYLVGDDNEEENNLFNDLFMSFLQSSFNIMVIDLLPAVQYCATYYGLALNFEDPITPEGSDLQDIDFEDYCSFQTHNPAARNYVFNTRFRGMYQ